MRRSDRLFDILRMLRGGGLHRAEDIAGRLGVSARTIYRDMEMLARSGVPVAGARGAGYRLGDTTMVPPLNLTPAEIAALNLGIAIVAEAADPDLRAAALSLADKIDAALPAASVAPAEAWKFATYSFADAARGIAHVATLRGAIKGRQKLRLHHRQPDGSVADTVVRPLYLEALGRVWILTAWCESRRGFRDFRVDLIDTATALPELFVDEPGKRLSDWRDRPAG